MRRVNGESNDLRVVKSRRMGGAGLVLPNQQHRRAALEHWPVVAETDS
jgi:hypothetical protein